MMARKLLLAMLGLSLAFELIFAGAGLVAPDWTLGQFGVAVTPDTRFLCFGLAWTFIFISLVCGLALRQVARRDANGHLLADVLGGWWIVVGLAVYFAYGKIDNLFIDSLKGALIVAFNRRAR